MRAMRLAHSTTAPCMQARPDAGCMHVGVRLQMGRKERACTSLGVIFSLGVVEHQTRWIRPRLNVSALVLDGILWLATCWKTDGPAPPSIHLLPCPWGRAACLTRGTAAAPCAAAGLCTPLALPAQLQHARPPDTATSLQRLHSKAS